VGIVLQNDPRRPRPSDSTAFSDAAEPACLDARPPLAVAVIGFGTMGQGIARVFAGAGHHVRAFDLTPGLVEEWLSKNAYSDRRNPDDVVSRIQAGTLVSTTVSGCDVVVEAVTEDENIKASVIAELSTGTSADCIIATNTSSYPIDTLAAHCDRPERFLGMHFFNPAELIPGVEVIPGSRTDPETIDRVLEILDGAGKRPVLVQSSAGFIANRLQMSLFLECARCVEEGLISPNDLDTVVSTTFGFRLPALGPFAIADMAGLDVYESILETLEGAFGERFRAPVSLSSLTSVGHYGVKTGVGFGNYGPDDATRLLRERDQTYLRLQNALRDQYDFPR